MTGEAMVTGAPPLLVVRDLRKSFPLGGGFLRPKRRWLRAVDGVSFHVGRGEVLGVVGESGCGKTTLGRLVLRLLEPTAGKIEFEGRDLAAIPTAAMYQVRARLQYIPQDPYGSLNPRLTVARMVAEPLLIHGLLRGAAAEERVGELLVMVGLRPEHARRYPHEFSGGQRQRITIARALASSPALIVADEPVSTLDVSVQSQVVLLMQKVQRHSDLSYLFISHDLGLVRYIADRVAVMYLGQIVEIAAKTRLFAAPLHPYTQALLRSIPPPDPSKRWDVVPLEGEIPNAVDPPPGCRFHTRCPLAEARCRTEVPALRLLEPDHQVSCHLAGSSVGQALSTNRG